MYDLRAVIGTSSDALLKERELHHSALRASADDDVARGVVASGRPMVSKRRPVTVASRHVLLCLLVVACHGESPDASHVWPASPLMHDGSPHDASCSLMMRSALHRPAHDRPLACCCFVPVVSPGYRALPTTLCDGPRPLSGTRDSKVQRGPTKNQICWRILYTGYGQPTGSWTPGSSCHIHWHSGGVVTGLRNSGNISHTEVAFCSSV